jgi:hypothetical protein
MSPSLACGLSPWRTRRTSAARPPMSAAGTASVVERRSLHTNATNIFTGRWVERNWARPCGSVVPLTVRVL